MLTLLVISLPAYAWKMESRVITLPATTGANNSPATIIFNQTFTTTPVVFALATSEGSQPGAVRVMNVTTTDFQIVQYEPPNLDGQHAVMNNVHYFAIEPGLHSLPDGTLLEAGAVATQRVQRGSGVGGPQSWETVGFASAFSARPILMAEIQTMANTPGAQPQSPLSPWLTAVVRNTGAASTELSLERSEVNSGSISQNETIGYVAIQPAAGVSGSFTDNASILINFDAFATGNVIDGWDNGCDTVAFPSVNSSTRQVHATKSTRNENDGGWLRRCSLGNNSIGLTVDEDQFFNSERSHGGESVDILVFSRPFSFVSLVPSPGSPAVQWRFDESQWNGTPGEVVDSIIGLNGTAFSATTITGQVCNAADLSANSTADYVSVNAAALNGATDFSISVWGKTSNTGNKGIISGANASQNNEMLMWFPNATTFTPFIKGSALSNISIANIADNNWHHFVWTRSGAQNCLYMDGNLQGCSNGSTQALSIANGGLIIGQEQDNVGGAFDINQDWEGLIDEPTIFNEALTPAAITSIYNNQLAGNDWNGAVRTCPVLPPTVDTIFKIEANTATLSPGSFTTINFGQTYVTPPAVFLLADTNNPDPTTARIRNITTTGFDVVPVEPPGLVSNPDVSTTIHYVVAEKGLNQFPDGSVVLVDEASVSAIQHGNGVAGAESYQTISFPNTFGLVPAVITQIQGMANEPAHTPGTPSAPWLTTAIESNSVTTSSFRVALERSEVNNGTVGSPETVAYMVMEPGLIASFNDKSGSPVLAEALITADNITGWGTCNTNNFGRTYPAPPLVIGDGNRHDGGDGGWLRRCSVSITNVGLTYDEDQDQNTERSHTTENAGLIVFSQPFVTDFGAPIADWHLDESSWNGTVDEVIDSSGNDFHGRAVNASPISGLLCNAADLTPNGTTDYLTMSNSAMNGLDDFTISVWSNNSNNDSRSLISGSSGSQHNELIMWFPNQSSFDPYVRGSNVGGSIPIPNINDGNWHHYAWTREGAQNCIYVDGVQQGCVNRGTGSLVIAPGGLIIGQEQDSLGGGFDPSQDWEGLVDEPIVFDRVLSAAEIQLIRTNQNAGNNWDGSPRACPSAGLDHFEIITGGATGSVCAIKQITVRACANPACSALVTNYSDTVTINTSSAVGNWSLVAGNGVLNPNPDTDNDGNVDYGFVTADSGSVVLGLDHNLAASTTITVTDGGSVTNTSTPIQFNENAFLIEDIDPLPGVDVPVAGRNHQYQATMIARLNSGSPQCSVVTAYGGNQALKGWVTRTPSDPGGAPPTIGGVPLPNSVPGADNLTLNFTAGVASFNLATSDVGQYAINLQEDNVVIPTIPPTNVPVTVIGSSNNATVRPFALDIDLLVGSPLVEDRQTNGTGGVSYAAGIGGSVFTRAGASFPTNVSGVLWQAADDNNVPGGDGVPDVGANLTNNPAAPNFGQEGETVTLNHSLVAPGGGASGTLTGTLINSFASGTGVTNLAWSEVGIIDLSASLTDSNYLGSGVNVTGNVVNVGRFIPDHLALSAGLVTEACIPALGTSHTYLGQNFTAQYVLTAENTSNVTTTNYRGSFVRLDATQGTLGYDAVDGVTALNVTPADKSGTVFAWGNGTGTMTATLAVIKGITPTGPFNAGIGVLPTDADNVTLATGALDLDTDLLVAGNEHKLIGNSTQRFGRLRGVSAFGPETQVLPVPILAEYFYGTSFITNIDDTCTNLLAANFDLNVIDDDASPDNSNNPAPGVITGLTIDSGSTNGVLGLPGFIGGDAGFTFSAPGTSNTSLIEIDLDLDEITNPLPWLKFDWTGVGDASPPQFDAVFGRYRGNDRIIYWREVF